MRSPLLGPSLQRIYDPQGAHEREPLPAATAQHFDSSEAALDLTESLLEAVFEISEYDPLPHFSFGDDDAGFGFPAASRQHSPNQHSPNSKHSISESGRAPAKTQARQPASTGPSQGQSGADRRGLPRRESECIVSVCPCDIKHRLTSERITWMLHATKLKGRLIDVSMSGAAFHLNEPQPAGSRILLRISNRTVDKQVDTTAVVLRSHAASDGGWNLVCRFEKNLTFEQIHTVGRSLFAATIV